MQCIIPDFNLVTERQILGNERIIMLRKLIFRSLIVSRNFSNPNGLVTRI